MKPIRCLAKMLGFRVGTWCSTPQCENFWRLADDRKFSFRTQKFVKILKMAYLKNGLRSAVAIYMAEIWPLLGFRGWNVRFLGIQPRSESDCPASLIFLRGPAARLYFVTVGGGWWVVVGSQKSGHFFVSKIAKNLIWYAPKWVDSKNGLALNQNVFI